MDHEEEFASKEDDIPWGKYTYDLEGLAKNCYLEGTASVDLSARPGAPDGTRLRFRVELPERCFILSMAIKLPDAPDAALRALDDVIVERTLRTAEYETIYDGVLSNRPAAHPLLAQASGPASLDAPAPGKRGAAGGDSNSPVAVEATAQPPAPAAEGDRRKRVMEIRRAADSLRITLADIDGQPGDRRLREFTDSESDAEDDDDAGAVRLLGVTVVGYVRGQTPKSGRIPILLNSSMRFGSSGAVEDRAEVDGLLGLAFLGNRRYRQAGELLERASHLTKQVAAADSKRGYSADLGFAWAAELNLLSAHAYFEHAPMSNDGIARLIAIVAPNKRGSALSAPGEFRNRAMDFLDVRTELLAITGALMDKLVRFLGESKSLAVQMASARMIEFVCEQLGCAIAPYLGRVLDQVLRSYPHCKRLGARERAAASSFSYDSMEDCYERLVDICCKLLPLTEHSILQKTLERTLIPVLLEAFDEEVYLVDSEDVEEECDELLCQAVAQTLRLIYLVLTVLGGDANVRPYLITKVLNMLIAKGGHWRTPVLLRRSALHAWDAITSSVVQSATNISVKEFKEYMTEQVEYLPNLIVTMNRRSFKYEDEDGNEVGADEPSSPKKKLGKSLQTVLAKCSKRTIIVDRHTLRRLLLFMKDTFTALKPCSDDDERHTATATIMDLQRILSEAAADVFVSSLMDVSYHAAAASGNGVESNIVFEHKSLSNQLKVSCDALSELIECFWAAISLLPPRSAETAEKDFLVRPVLTWCVQKMKKAAPPKGLLRLLLCVVRAFDSDACVLFTNCSVATRPGDDVTALDLYRANTMWLAQTPHTEALELHDLLCPIVGKYLMAKDIVNVIVALGDQADAEEGVDERTDISIGVLSSMVALTTPAKPELTKKSLKDLLDPKQDKQQRIVNGFPKSSNSARFGGQITRKLRFQATNADSDPMYASLYIHIVMMSCFDFFESLDSPIKRQGGAIYMGQQLDAFIEHAALLVRCFKDCAKHQKHREYIGATLGGDILGTCLAMQSNGDGRVRLAGFEIFASALDVLFLAEETSSNFAQKTDSLVSDTTGLGAMHVRTISSLSAANASNSLIDTPGSVKELGPGGDKLERKSSANQKLEESPAADVSKTDGGANGTDDKAAKKELLDEELQEIYANGGSYVFHADSLSASDLNFEDKGWQFLCVFITESVGIGRYADFVVRRACLEYLRQCIIKALQGSASGASVISFAHVGQIWDAVLRLVDSPVQSLNNLSFWVICATVNVGIYSAVLAKGRGASKQRASELENFLFNRLFVTAESYIKSGNKEARLWGVRLLEVYFRARSMNENSWEVCPAPPKKILAALTCLKDDWCEESRNLAKCLLDLHYDMPEKKQPTASSSFTNKASSFMTIKRLGYQDGNGDADSQATIELWFPPLPQQSSVAQMEKFGKTLESFANTEIMGGEETDLSEHDEEDGYGDDDDGYGDDYEEGDGIEYEEDDEPPLYEDDDDSEALPDDEDGETDADGEEKSQVEQELAPSVVEPAPSPVKLLPSPVEVPKKEVVQPISSEEKEREKEKRKKEMEKERAEQEKAELEKAAREKAALERAAREKAAKEKAAKDKAAKEKAAKEKAAKEKAAKEKAEREKQEALEREDELNGDDSFFDEDEEDEWGGIAISDEEEYLLDDDSPKSKKSSDVKSSGFLPADMDEKMPSRPYKRTGSFIGRPQKDISGEGDAPKLVKRRSVDTVGLGSKSFKRLVEATIERKRLEGEEPSSSPSSHRRLGYRESPAKEGQDPAALRESGPSSSKSFSNSRSSKDLVNSGFLPLRGSRVKRGVNLDAEIDEPGREAKVGDAVSAGADDMRPKDSGSRSFGPSSRGRRSLPRAPAFVKGGAARRPGSQLGGQPGAEASSGSGAGGSPPLAPLAGRPRLPRARSSSRGIDGVKRIDRTQRFGKRDFNLDLIAEAAAEEEAGAAAVRSAADGSSALRPGAPRSDLPASRSFNADKRKAKRHGSSPDLSNPSGGQKEEDK